MDWWIDGLVDKWRARTLAYPIIHQSINPFIQGGLLFGGLHRYRAGGQRWLRYSSMRWALRSKNGVCSLDSSVNFFNAFIACLNSSENFSCS